MNDKTRDPTNKADSGTTEKNRPGHVGGDHIRKAQKWGGGSKASKGPITEADKRNPNTSAKS